MKTTDIIKSTFFFFLFQLALLFTPGPTYFFGLLLVLFLGSFILKRNISFSLFFVYLLVIFNHSPLIQLNKPECMSMNFWYQQSFCVPIVQTVTLKTLVSILLFVSIVLNYKSKLVRFIKSNKIVVLPLLSIFVLICNQIFGNYEVNGLLSIVTLLSLFFALINTLFILWIDKKNATKLVIAFCFSSVIFFFLISTLEFIFNILNSNLSTYLSQLPVASYSFQHIFRSQGPFGHPNFLAVNVGILCSFVASNLNSESKIIVRGRHFQLLVIVTIVMGLVTIALSKTRIVLATLLFTFLIAYVSKTNQSFLFFLSKKNIINNYKLKIILVLVVVFLALATFGRSEGLTTLEGRWITFLQAIKITSEKPIFGTGPELSTFYIAEFYNLEHEYMDSLRGIHTSILLLTAENGIIIGILVLMFFYFLFKNVTNNINNNKNLPLSRMALYSLIFFITASFFYPLYIYDSSFELIQILTATSFFQLVIPQSEKQPSRITTFPEQNSG